ncbi:hypothetical protein ACFX5K_06215 [Rickettsiales bacterium LUAb2]
MSKPNPFKLNKEDTVDSKESSNINQKVAIPNNIKLGTEINSLFSKKEKEKKIITTIYITENLSKKLNKIAKDNDISVNEVVTTILEKTL